MWFLLGTTLTASFFDSLNPSAIAQQMLLQAMVKKKRHIWFFICGIGTANLIMGLAIYYGIATWVSKFLTKIVNAYPLYVYGAAAIGGIVLLGAGIWLIIKTRQSNAGKNNNGCEETENVKAPAQLSPVSLFIMGTSAGRRWPSSYSRTSRAEPGARGSSSSTRRRRAARRSATLPIAVSWTRSGAGGCRWGATVPVSSGATSTTAGTTSCTWTPRTPAGWRASWAPTRRAR